MSSEKGPKYIYAQEHKLYSYSLCHFGERGENKNWKKKTTTKHSISSLKNFSFTTMLSENINKHCNGLSIFFGHLISYNYLILTFHRFILPAKIHSAYSTGHCKLQEEMNDEWGQIKGDEMMNYNPLKNISSLLKTCWNVLFVITAWNLQSIFTKLRFHMWFQWAPFTLVANVVHANEIILFH